MGPSLPAPVPVLLTWLSCDRVVLSDALRSLSADLNPTFALDNMQQLPPGCACRWLRALASKRTTAAKMDVVGEEAAISSREPVSPVKCAEAIGLRICSASDCGVIC